MSDYGFSLKTSYSSNQDGCNCKIKANDTNGFDFTVSESGDNPYNVLNKVVNSLVNEYNAAAHPKKIKQTPEEKLATITKKYEDALARIDQLENRLKIYTSEPKKNNVKNDFKISEAGNKKKKKKDFQSRYIEELNKLLKSL